MSRCKIVIIGNSESLFIRPPRRETEQGTYTEIIRQKIECAEIVNSSSGSLEIRDVLANFNELLHRHFPDVVILHFGIVEAAPRMLPRFLWRFIYADKNKYLLSPSVMKIFIFLRKTFGRLTKWYLLIFKMGGWVRLSKFEYIYSQLVERIIKELRCKIILLNIGLTSQRLKQAVPGIDRKIAQFNEVISQIVWKNSKINLVDICSITEKMGIEAVRPDGVHFNAEGHRIIAEEILRVLAVAEEDNSRD